MNPSLNPAAVAADQAELNGGYVLVLCLLILVTAFFARDVLAAWRDGAQWRDAIDDTIADWRTIEDTHQEPAPVLIDAEKNGWV